jgi:hypothetical protein
MKLIGLLFSFEYRKNSVYVEGITRHKFPPKASQLIHALIRVVTIPIAKQSVFFHRQCNRQVFPLIHAIPSFPAYFVNPIIPFAAGLVKRKNSKRPAGQLPPGALLR